MKLIQNKKKDFFSDFLFFDCFFKIILFNYCFLLIAEKESMQRSNHTVPMLLQKSKSRSYRQKSDFVEH